LGLPKGKICLGSQLVAHALGARVYPNERDGEPAKEIGYYTVHLTPEGKADPLFKGFDSGVRVLEWHGDAFELPRDASLLATSRQGGSESREAHEETMLYAARQLLLSRQASTKRRTRQIEVMPFMLALPIVFSRFQQLAAKGEEVLLLRPPPHR
jgi:hypothetical protein